MNLELIKAEHKIISKIFIDNRNTVHFIYGSKRDKIKNIEVYTYTMAFLRLTRCILIDMAMTKPVATPLPVAMATPKPMPVAMAAAPPVPMAPPMPLPIVPQTQPVAQVSTKQKGGTRRSKLKRRTRKNTKYA